MREILFRGKRAGNGEWVEGYYYVETGCLIKEKPSLISTTASLVIPETVGQFTGLTDKNGNKIFEGDIVEITVPLKDTKPIIKKCEVYFCERGFCVKWQTSNYSLSDFAPCVDIEVIGNIYDNPEWLKGGVRNA